MRRQARPHAGEDLTVSHIRQSVSKDLCTRTQCRSLRDEVTDGTSKERSKIDERGGKKQTHYYTASEKVL